MIADLDELYTGVEDLIANVDYLIVSRDFPDALTGERSLEQALRRMKSRYGCAVTAATLGQDGVLAWDGSRFHLRPAYCVAVADTTGAGDIFHAGFIYGLLQGWPLAAAAGFCLRGRRAELHGKRRARRHWAVGGRGGADGLDAAVCDCARGRLNFIFLSESCAMSIEKQRCAWSGNDALMRPVSR